MRQFAGSALAVSLLVSSAAASDPRWNEASKALYGEGVSQDCEKAFRLYKSLFDEGHLYASRALENFSSGSAGSPKCPSREPEKAEDYNRLVNLNIEANEESGGNDPLAQFQLGLHYADGDIVPRNDAEALQWFRKSASGGDFGGLWAVGWFHRDGRAGLKSDTEEAARWFKKSAEKGSELAMYDLALLYVGTRGHPKDFSAAMKWFRKSADKGFPDALYSIGIMHENGEGVKADQAEAMRWYRKAAEKGVELGQHRLGTSYRDGKGVAKDEIEAYRWLRLAAQKNCNKAAEEADALAKTFTPEQLKKAEALAAK